MLYANGQIIIYEDEFNGILKSAVTHLKLKYVVKDEKIYLFAQDLQELIPCLCKFDDESTFLEIRLLIGRLLIIQMERDGVSAEIIEGRQIALATFESLIFANIEEGEGTKYKYIPLSYSGMPVQDFDNLSTSIRLARTQNRVTSLPNPASHSINSDPQEILELGEESKQEHFLPLHPIFRTLLSTISSEYQEVYLKTVDDKNQKGLSFFKKVLSLVRPATKSNNSKPSKQDVHEIKVSGKQVKDYSTRDLNELLIKNIDSLKDKEIINILQQLIENFRDPVQLILMVVPVTLESGHTYDYSSVYNNAGEIQFPRRQCPKTNIPILNPVINEPYKKILIAFHKILKEISLCIVKESNTSVLMTALEIGLSFRELGVLSEVKYFIVKAITENNTKLVEILLQAYKSDEDHNFDFSRSFDETYWDTVIANNNPKMAKVLLNYCKALNPKILGRLCNWAMTNRYVDFLGQLCDWAVRGSHVDLLFQFFDFSVKGGHFDIYDKVVACPQFNVLKENHFKYLLIAFENRHWQIFDKFIQYPGLVIDACITQAFQQQYFQLAEKLLRHRPNNEIKPGYYDWLIAELKEHQPTNITTIVLILVKQYIGLLVQLPLTSKEKEELKIRIINAINLMDDPKAIVNFMRYLREDENCLPLRRRERNFGFSFKGFRDGEHEVSRTFTTIMKAIKLRLAVIAISRDNDGDSQFLNHLKDPKTDEGKLIGFKRYRSILFWQESRTLSILKTENNFKRQDLLDHEVAEFNKSLRI